MEQSASTPNITAQNIDKILELFPAVAIETENGKKVIDFEKLKQELSEYIVEDEERYEFTWIGKKESILEANRPIQKILVLDRDSSVDWDNTFSYLTL